ncbi:MAG: alpha/beta fold hydrolase, partial [Chloroflexia bacterium]
MVEERDGTTELNLSHIVRPAQAAPPEQQRSPGLLLLHGRGADEYDLMGLEEGLDPRLTIVSARAPNSLGGGFTWYDLYRLGEPDARTVQSSLEKLRRFVESMVDAYRIDPKRLYLMGFSQGALMSAALALVVPEKVRGVIMHSGYVPTDAVPESNPTGLQGKPFFVAHGKYDDVIPVAYG